MSENLVYADLNLTESTKPRLVKITDVQGATYAEVKVESLDTNAAASYISSDPGCHTDTINFKDSRRGKSYFSRTCVAVLVAVIILLLVIAVCLILMLTPGLVLRTGTSKNPPQQSGGNYKENHTACPQNWEKYGRKCYYFSQVAKITDWNSSRQECNSMDSDLVIIDDKEELNYLTSRSEGHYYLLGLTYYPNEFKWKWINNAIQDTNMFKIEGNFSDYLCAVIGHCKVQSTSCSGSSTTKNMCEKAANIKERWKES